MHDNWNGIRLTSMTWYDHITYCDGVCGVGWSGTGVKNRDADMSHDRNGVTWLSGFWQPTKTMVELHFRHMALCRQRYDNIHDGKIDILTTVEFGCKNLEMHLEMHLEMTKFDTLIICQLNFKIPWRGQVLINALPRNLINMSHAYQFFSVF